MQVILLLMKITTKGQVTIPQNLRQRYGLLPDTEVVFESVAEGILLRPAAEGDAAIGERLDASTGRAAVAISTDDILRMTRGED